MIDKRELLVSLRARLAGDLAALEQRQRDTQEGTTHEEGRAEHAKDTRATEQSYLARGLAERVEDLRRADAALVALRIRDFAPDEAIAVTALAVVASEPDAAAGDAAAGETQTWWLVSSAGGVELVVGRAIDKRRHSDGPPGVSIVTTMPRATAGRRVCGESKARSRW